MKTVGDEFPVQQARCRELLRQYQDIGVPGRFGAVMIEQALRRADEAMASGDIVQILRAYQEMKEFK